jgi:hypothetical protein
LNNKRKTLNPRIPSEIEDEREREREREKKKRDLRGLEVNKYIY